MRNLEDWKSFQFCFIDIFNFLLQRVIETDNPRKAKSINVTSKQIQHKPVNDTRKNETLPYVNNKLERPISLNNTTKQENLKSLNDTNIQGKLKFKNDTNEKEISKSLIDTTDQENLKSLNDTNIQEQPIFKNDTTKEQHSKSEHANKKKRRPYSLTETVCRIFKQHPYVTLMPPSCKDILGSLMK